MYVEIIFIIDMIVDNMYLVFTIIG